MTVTDRTILDPDLPIIDPHHHLFVRPQLRYLADEFAADLASGHNIVGTIFVEAGAYLRPDGPEWLRPIGEIEFANGVAAMGAAGYFGGTKVGMGIIGHVDLRLGERLDEQLDRSLAAAPDRYRGVRQLVVDHPSPTAFKFMTHRPPTGLLRDPAFQAGLKLLAPRGLSFDLGVYHVQFPDVGALADASPDTCLVLDHMGMIMGLDHDAEGREALRKAWVEDLRELARRPNLICKLGGLGMPVWGLGFHEAGADRREETLLAAWRPYIEPAIEAFGVDRCMFESNFPIDKASCDYASLWNIFKRLAAGCSDEEKDALFSGTASRIYRLDLPQG